MFDELHLIIRRQDLTNRKILSGDHAKQGFTLQCGDNVRIRETFLLCPLMKNSVFVIRLITIVTEKYSRWIICFRTDYNCLLYK